MLSSVYMLLTLFPLLSSKSHPILRYIETIKKISFLVFYRNIIRIPYKSFFFQYCNYEEESLIYVSKKEGHDCN